MTSGLQEISQPVVHIFEAVNVKVCLYPWISWGKPEIFLIPESFDAYERFSGGKRNVKGYNKTQSAHYVYSCTCESTPSVNNIRKKMIAQNGEAGSRVTA
jgi:hypothetical protein